MEVIVPRVFVCVGTRAPKYEGLLGLVYRFRIFDGLGVNYGWLLGHILR